MPHLDTADAERVGRFAYQPELRHEIAGRRTAMGFVLVVEAVAERAPGGIEDDRNVVGVVSCNSFASMLLKPSTAAREPGALRPQAYRRFVHARLA